MKKIRDKFQQVGFDEFQYQRYFHQNQAEYLRTKLRCVRMYAQGDGFGQISSTLGVHTQSARKYVNTYLSGGFEQLCRPTVRQQPCLLSDEQADAFKDVLLVKRPEDGCGQVRRVLCLRAAHLLLRMGGEKHPSQGSDQSHRRTGKKRKRTNGLLAINLFTAEFHRGGGPLPGQPGGQIPADRRVFCRSGGPVPSPGV